MLIRASRNGPLIPYNVSFLHNRSLYRAKGFFKVHKTSITVIAFEFTIKYNVVKSKNVVLACCRWSKVQYSIGKSASSIADGEGRGKMLLTLVICW